MNENEGTLALCDNCKVWFHPLCLKISKIEIHYINTCKNNKWYCRNCIN